jgi:hypothetical protein
LQDQKDNDGEDALGEIGFGTGTSVRGVKCLMICLSDELLNSLNLVVTR